MLNGILVNENFSLFEGSHLQEVWVPFGVRPLISQVKRVREFSLHSEHWRSEFHQRGRMGS